MFKKDQINKKAELALSKARHHANAKWNKRKSCEIGFGEENEFRIVPVLSIGGSKVDFFKDMVEAATGIRTSSVLRGRRSREDRGITTPGALLEQPFIPSLEGRVVLVQTSNMTFKNMHRRTDTCIWLIRNPKLSILTKYLEKNLDLNLQSYVSSSSALPNLHQKDKINLLLTDNLAWKSFKSRSIYEFESIGQEVIKYCPNFKIIFYEDLVASREKMAKLLHSTCSFLNSHNKLFIPFHKDCLKREVEGRLGNGLWGPNASSLDENRSRKTETFDEQYSLTVAEVDNFFTEIERLEYNNVLKSINNTWDGMLPGNYLFL